MPPLNILLDHNVGDSIGEVFVARGHDVARVREVLTEHDADLTIWATATERNIVVVSFDRDFRMIATRFPLGQAGIFKRRAGLISLSGLREAVARRRVSNLIPVIEFVHGQAVERRVRLLMNVTATSYTVVDNASLRPE